MATSAPPSTAAIDRRKQALERRFAIAKAELLQEQNRSNFKRRKPNDFTEQRTPRSDSIDPITPKSNPLHGSSSSASCHSLPTTSAYGSTSYGEASRRSGAHFIYSELGQGIHEKLLKSETEALPAARKDEVVKNIILDMCLKGDDADKFAKGSRYIRLNEVFLLDNVVGKDVARAEACAKAFKSLSNRSWRHMSMREHRKCGSFCLPNEFYKFDLFRTMHDMWKEYITELMEKRGNKQLAQCLLAADLHGSVLNVVECKVASLRGVRGIMIRETANTFGVLSQDNRFHVIPKEGSIFIYRAGRWKITLHGDQLSLRSMGT